MQQQRYLEIGTKIQQNIIENSESLSLLLLAQSNLIFADWRYIALCWLYICICDVVFYITVFFCPKIIVNKPLGFGESGKT